MQIKSTSRKNQKYVHLNTIVRADILINVIQSYVRNKFQYVFRNTYKYMDKYSKISATLTFHKCLDKHVHYKLVMKLD